MKDQIKILAISGSTRQHSANLNLINAIKHQYADLIDIKIFNTISDISHFNPDLDNENPPAKVLDFREQLKEAKGVIICTPEYAMGVPGTLKNAIDWTVSSMEFSHKPVALITASTAGQKGHQSLLETLKIIEANIPENSQLLISHIKTKLSNNKITDSDTATKVDQVIQSLINSIKT